MEGGTWNYNKPRPPWTQVQSTTSGTTVGHQFPLLLCRPHPENDLEELEQFDTGKRMRTKTCVACDGLGLVVDRHIHAPYNAHDERLG